MLCKKQRADHSFRQSIPSNRQILLTTNHYYVDVPKCLIFHYDVKISRGKFQNGQFIDSFTDCHQNVMNARIKSQDRLSTYHRIVMTKFVSQQQVDGGLFYEPSRMSVLRPVFDGVQNLYTIRPIPFHGTKKTIISSHFVKLEDNDLHCYRIRIRFATEVDFSKLTEYVRIPTASVYQDAIRALDIILRSGPSAYQIPIGNCIFPNVEDVDTKPVDIGRGKHVVSGHYQSVRKTASGLSLVIDRSSTVFYKACDLIDFVRTIIKSAPARKGGINLTRNTDPLVHISLIPHQPGIEANLALIEKELMNLTIEVNHTPSKMKFKFHGLTRTSANETFFSQTTDQGERNISVADFFREKYSVSINYKNLPCAIVGNVKRPSYLPLEVCQLVARQQPRTLNQQETTSFIKNCAQNCDNRFRVIADSASLVKQTNCDYLSEFSIDLSSKPVEVDGFCLEIPKISTKDESFAPESGKWSIKDKKISKGCSIPDRRWYIVNFTKQSPSLINQFAERLRTFAGEKGASIGEPNLWENGASVHYDCNAVKRVLSKIYDRYRDRRIDLPYLIMFIITRSKDDSIYHEIKRYGDVEFGFNTQCVIESNLKTSIHDKGCFILSNIFLKMNAKLGGINNIIDVDTNLNTILCNESTIIIGADVTHPTDKMSYSVAACVANFDKSHTKYAASVRLQHRSRDEIITDLPDMVYELLKNYVEKNKRSDSDSIIILPESIIFYRDGVSDGQFEKVLEQEVGRMSEAFERITRKYNLKSTYRPTVTFIVVQKRHHTRLMPSNVTDSDGKAKNVPSGTLVNQKIVATNDGSDFYLCSHSSPLGTSKPSHYYILMDENNFPLEDLYRLTFNLCHIYVKCTRVISIPAPVQYAHLAAFRARQHLLNIGRMDDKRFSDDPDYERQEIEKSIRIHYRLTADFYFI